METTLPQDGMDKPKTTFLLCESLFQYSSYLRYGEGGHLQLLKGWLLFLQVRERVSMQKSQVLLDQGN